MNPTIFNVCCLSWIVDKFEDRHLTAEKLIHKYIIRGQSGIKKLQYLINVKGVNLNWRLQYDAHDVTHGEEYFTPLIAAVQHRNVDAVKLLLANGANCNDGLLEDSSELAFSFRNNIQKFLYKGTTPLLFSMLIICDENQMTENDWLEVQRSVDRSASGQETALREDREKKFFASFEILQLLLDCNKVDVTISDRLGTSPQSLAKYLAHPRSGLKTKYQVFPDISKTEDKIMQLSRLVVTETVSSTYGAV